MLIWYRFENNLNNHGILFHKLRGVQGFSLLIFVFGNVMVGFCNFPSLFLLEKKIGREKGVENNSCYTSETISFFHML